MAWGAWKWGALACAVLNVGVDQATKAYVLETFPLGPGPWISPCFQIYVTHNTGIAFGVGQEWRTVIVWVVCAILGVLLYQFLRLPVHARAVAIALSLIVAGALGNLWDRIQRGAVVDFILLHIGSWHFPGIFNWADVCVCVGSLLLCVYGGRRSG